ncbi:MAG: T9SS type A sorting domain-containing protein [Saprospiraceae bacterium]|nr:T9SS type A sorting domain-containing protein [Saprospiraceae bacterium]
MVFIGSNSNAVGVTDRPINRLALLSCNPNPTEGILQIQLDKSVLSLRPSIEVYNSTGQSIMKNDINSEAESIDLESFPSGTYFLRVVSSTGTIGLEKILKY